MSNTDNGMNKIVASRSRRTIDRDVVLRMVNKEQYIILAHDFDFNVLKERGRTSAETDIPAIEPIICDSVECIEKEAIRLLTDDSEQMVVHRQAAYRLLPGFARREYLYHVSLPAAKAVMESVSAGETVRRKLIEEWVSGRFSERMYKDAGILVMNLVMLNFAYAEPWYLEYVIPGTLRLKRRQGLNLVGATYQTLALISNIPFRTARESALSEAAARDLVEVAIEARRRAVYLILDVGVRRVRDLYDNLAKWLSDAVLTRSNIPDAAKAMTAVGALIEATIVPYYLAYYGFIGLDFRSLRFFELKR